MIFIDSNEKDLTFLNNKKVIGVDESGVGDYFGPLCAAAVYIPLQNRNKVLELGVKDSKKLTDKKILEIAPTLKKLVLFSTNLLYPKGFNSLVKNNYNTNALKMFVHLKTINTLETKIKDYDFVVIDQYSTQKSIEGYYSLMFNKNWANFNEVKENIILIKKAENKCLEVAAASILARELFLLKMQEMNQKYEVVFPFGSSEKVKQFANTFFENKTEEMENVCKMIFNMNK